MRWAAHLILCTTRAIPTRMNLGQLCRSQDLSWAHLKSLNSEKHPEERGKFRACEGMNYPFIIELEAFRIVIRSETNEGPGGRNDNEQGCPQCHGNYKQIDDECHGERRSQNIVATAQCLFPISLASRTEHAV